MAANDGHICVKVINVCILSFVFGVLSSGSVMHHAGEHCDVMTISCPYPCHFIEAGTTAIVFLKEILMYEQNTQWFTVSRYK